MDVETGGSNLTSKIITTDRKFFLNNGVWRSVKAPSLWCPHSHLAEFQLVMLCVYQPSRLSSQSQWQWLSHVTAPPPDDSCPRWMATLLPISSFVFGVDSSCFPPGERVTSTVASLQGFSRIFAGALRVQRRKVTWNPTRSKKYQSHHNGKEASIKGSVD